LSNLGVVGVNSRIVQSATMDDQAVAPGWPLDPRFNRYLYVFNEFIAVDSTSIEGLLEKARLEGFRVEESDGQSVLDFSKKLQLEQELLDGLTSTRSSLP